ncbi:hypothetical protein GGR57DRAFT_223557 [Xylariaceae sp. FL1272]|nr:hypothetical protein GGR57DRAFT_223557 [Xylariaceae sp. FL1272]
MAEEPTLPSLPRVQWNSQAQTFDNTRKRNRGPVSQPLFSNSSDPAVFSSDDDPDVENYANGRHRKKRYYGSWFQQQQLPTSSDSTFGEDKTPLPKPKRTFERQVDSGVWMDSDGSVGLEEEFSIEIEAPIEPKLSSLRVVNPAQIISSEEALVRQKVEEAIEEGNESVDLSSLGVSSISNETVARLSELSVIPSVNKDVPFEQKSPEIGLYLSNNYLTRAPGALFNLEHLTHLSLRNNQIADLPPSIGKLRNLRTINISLNRLRYLPGELLDLLKFPSSLENLNIHPNPFYRSESNVSPQPGFDGAFPHDVKFVVMHDNAVTEETRRQATESGRTWAWQAAILARSPLQYSDSRGSILSKFVLPFSGQTPECEAEELRSQQQVILPTEDLASDPQLNFPGQNVGAPRKPSSVLSLFELALQSSSRAAQTWDLASWLPPTAPPSIIRCLDRIKEQSQLNANEGTLPCSICGRHIVTPTVQWIEWWIISKWRNDAASEPLSNDPLENTVPFLKRGCSWNCVPKPMKKGEAAPL